MKSRAWVTFTPGAFPTWCLRLDRLSLSPSWGKYSPLLRETMSSTRWTPSARASGRSLRSTGSDIDTIPLTVLIIDKAVSKTSVYAGETFYYTVTIQNISLSLINANVTDAFSSYLDITDCKLSYISPNIAATNCFVTNRTLTTFVSLQPFQTAKIVIAARGNTTVGNLFKNVGNTATITWGTPTNTRISNEVDITIFPSGFLAVGKSDNNDTVYLGQSISYTVSISNVGSLAISANTLRVTDTFLSNISFTGLNASGLDHGTSLSTAGSCAPGTSRISRSTRVRKYPS